MAYSDFIWWWIRTCSRFFRDGFVTVAGKAITLVTAGWLYAVDSCNCPLHDFFDGGDFKYGNSNRAFAGDLWSRRRSIPTSSSADVASNLSSHMRVYVACGHAA